MNISKPIIFHNKEEVPSSAKLIEAFDGSLKELFFINNPQFKKGMPAAEKPLFDFLSNHGITEIWIYYPWSDIAVHCVPENIYLKLRTARNRNIINENEQQEYRNMKVGIAGLSVGSAVLSALVISGGPQKLKIADFDILELSNLNRIKANITDIGQNKTHIAARQVWELDPFADLFLWDNGLTHENIDDFILADPRLNVFIDEMDSLDLKVLARLICKKNKIPVLMATDNGDGVILDVERYDKEPERPLFHGLVGNIQPEDVSNLDFKHWVQLATKIIGPEYLTERMQDSLLGIGKDIAAVPQLGTSTQMAGSSMVYAIRRIANQQDMPSGRYTVSLEEKFIPGYIGEESEELRDKKTEEFKAKFGK